jgi:hypothetical protein
MEARHFKCLKDEGDRWGNLDELLEQLPHIELL